MTRVSEEKSAPIRLAAAGNPLREQEVDLMRGSVFGISVGDRMGVADLDRQPVDLVFTLLAPADDSPEHLKALALATWRITWPR